MNIWILLTSVLFCAYIPQQTSSAHHGKKMVKRQVARPIQPRPGFRIVKTRVRPSSTTPPPEDYYYYEEEVKTPAPPPPRFRGRGKPRFGGQQKQPATPIPPPPSYEEELAHYGYSFASPKPDSKAATTTTTTTTTPAPTDPPRTLSPNYRQRPDGRIIDFRADPNFPRELKGADLTEYPFYEHLPDNIIFDCDKVHDGFYASIPHRCQLFHYCYGGIRYDFLCPNYTLYDQTTFTCRFINTVECEKSELHYNRNEALYKETTTEALPKPTTTPTPRRKPVVRKKPTPLTTTSTAPPDEYDYEYDDEEEPTTSTTTTTTTTQRPKRRRLRPRLGQRPGPPGAAEPSSKK